MVTTLKILSYQSDNVIRAQTCPEDNLLNTVYSKAMEYLSPLTDDVDCKITEHNITLFKLFPITTSVWVASNHWQDLDFYPATHSLDKLIKVCEDAVPDLKCSRIPPPKLKRWG